jgi:hypothetical protein
MATETALSGGLASPRTGMDNQANEIALKTITSHPSLEERVRLSPIRKS